jgi:hypothetical protein
LVERQHRFFDICADCLDVAALGGRIGDIRLRCPIEEAQFEELVGQAPFRFPHELWFTPPAVLEAIVRILSGRNRLSALDPWAGGGILLAGLVEAKVVKSGVGLLRDRSDWVMAKLIANDFPIEWVNTAAVPWLSSHEDQFDLVVGMPPFGMQKEERAFSPEGKPLLVKDETGRLVMLEALTRLTEDGVGIIVAPSFDARSAPTSVYNQLHRFGLRVDAVFSLPDSPFKPMSNISGIVAVVIWRGTAKYPAFL